MSVKMELDQRRKDLVAMKLKHLQKKNKMRSNSKNIISGDKHLFFQEITTILCIEFNPKKQLSSGSTVQTQGLKDIFDCLNKDKNIVIQKKTKFSYLEEILNILNENFDKRTDTSGGSTITTWALFKIIRGVR